MRRLAMITGACGGIGRATVDLFVQQGWAVIAVDRRPADALCEGATERRVDVSDPGQMEALFQWVSDQHGSLHALVNNAAIQINKPLIETSVEEWDQVMLANLRSAFLGSKLAHPLLRSAQGSAIVNVSSVHALATSANVAAYAASKGALLAFTRACAIEFAPDDIRVNAVLPGAVDTEMLRSGLERGHLEGAGLGERLESLARRTVMGRVGLPEEIARAIYFLADDQHASFMTGQALVVDGGATARLSTE